LRYDKKGSISFLKKETKSFCWVAFLSSKSFLVLFSKKNCFLSSLQQAKMQ